MLKSPETCCKLLDRRYPDEIRRIWMHLKGQTPHPKVANASFRRRKIPGAKDNKCSLSLKWQRENHLL